MSEEVTALKSELKMIVEESFTDFLVILALLAMTLGMFLTAPVGGDFSWSDAPRHAMNGAFIMDLLHDHPWGHATAWAMDYYIRYPAITILFYPPLFYFVEAGFFAVFGVTHAAAQLSESLFVFLLAGGSYLFARQWFPKVASLGVAMLTIGAPEIAYWDRQIMLDIPAISLGLFGMLSICHYLRKDSPRYLYVATVFFLAAIYTKYNVGILILPAAAAMLMAKGWRVFDRHVLLTMALGLIGILPAAFMMYKFGSANVDSVSGLSDSMSRTSLAAWTYYIQLMPRQLGYATILLAIAGFAIIGGIGIDRQFFRKYWTIEPWTWMMLGVWFYVGYIVLSFIGLKESRVDLTILFPVILMAAFAVMTLMGRGIMGQVALLLMGVGTYCYSLVWYPPPVVKGYDEIAAYVTEHAAPNAVVMFSGYRDGNLIFDLRQRERHDLTVIRAAKVLLKVSIERRRGVVQNDLDEAAIRQMLIDDGVSMIITQRGFWPDLTEMQRFTTVLQGDDFHLVTSFPVTGSLYDYDGPDASGVGMVDIYVPTYQVQPPKGPITIDLPIIGSSVTGKIGKTP